MPAIPLAGGYEKDFSPSKPAIPLLGGFGQGKILLIGNEMGNRANVNSENGEI